MTDIDKSVYLHDAVIRVSLNETVLNRKAVELLGIQEGDRVRIRYDEMESLAGRDRVYISKSNGSVGFLPRQTSYSFKIFSRSLSRALARHLQGFGAYRICPEVTKEIDGVTNYEIFFRKYE